MCGVVTKFRPATVQSPQFGIVHEHGFDGEFLA
jgi:hypothetical protein